MHSALLLQIVQVTLPVFGIATIGYIYGRIYGSDILSVNRINMNLFVPALLFYILSEKIPDSQDWITVAWGALLIILVSGIVSWPATRLLNIRPRVLLPSMMFNNAGNLGLPLAALAFGEELLPLAVVAFVVSTSLHFSLGIWLVSGSVHPNELLKNPVFLATLAGILAYAFDWHVPQIVMPGLVMLSEVAIPLMLVSLGIRLIHIEPRFWKAGMAGALLCPLSGLIGAWLAIAWLQPNQEMRDILLLFSILPPAVMNYMLAESYQQSPQKVAAIVAFGNLGSLIVIPVALAFIF
ncbi:MAG: AEC family transporter [Candidatus Thiodiazotropha sp. (ex Ctena orbiculata)]|uniref:AEC family transporter n=1 Tax=Candidatus Thiodiazotropha taylori TaxID=2792791 RepID=A0A944M4K1_9GAMM|nr:AEC family transporter [Candidatus Thiodiazotropha taylori]MBT3028616.1 AEC family transporter [Candidatus Thiodiazotropha taylori]MBT3036245.1 AEC family transporter [Candidatus Thiodiazotropha taylori]MBV2138360.1 AEC family transporter [Candidatus Thiodiazotropha taylori]PUB84286.1 MAG: AEC family transporter [gamma proteobacterium symbiont of Ctena orbiculata]